MIFVITVHLTILDFKSVNAQKGSEIVEIKNANVDEKTNQLLCLILTFKIYQKQE